MQVASPRVARAFVVGVAVITALTGPMLLINPGFVEALQQRHDVADRLRLSQDEIGRINGEMLWDIFTGGDFDISLANGQAVLDEDERAHMLDVSHLVRLLVLVLAASIGAAAYGGRRLRDEPRRLGRLLIRGAGGVAVAAAVIGLFAVLAWETAFNLFHQILFAPGTWSFPPDSMLVQLYPPAFWFDATLVAGATILLIGGAFSYAGWRRIGEEEGPAVKAAPPTC